MELSPKQKAFADYYIELGNATEASIRAGYSKKYAGTNTDKLLNNTNIANYINIRMKEIESKRIADAKEVMEYLTSVMRGEVKDAFPAEFVRNRNTRSGKGQCLYNWSPFVYGFNSLDQFGTVALRKE